MSNGRPGGLAGPAACGRVRPVPQHRSPHLEDKGPQRPLLSDPGFRNPWLAVEFSFLGMFIHVVAGSWLMAELTGSALHVSLIQTAYALPIVLFSILAGALADTLDRRRSMVLALVFCLAVSVLLAVMAWFGWLTPNWILGLIFAVGCGVALFTPTWQAALGDIAPRDQLVEAVSLHNIGANAMRTIGPSLGGLLVSAAGAPVAFAAGALTYLPALLLMVLRPPRLTAVTDREGVGSVLVLGLRYLKVAPKLELVLLRAFFFAFTAMCTMGMLPLVAQVQYGLGAQCLWPALWRLRSGGHPGGRGPGPPAPPLLGRPDRGGGVSGDGRRAGCAGGE